MLAGTPVILKENHYYFVFYVLGFEYMTFVDKQV